MSRDMNFAEQERARLEAEQLADLHESAAISCARVDTRRRRHRRRPGMPTPCSAPRTSAAWRSRSADCPVSAGRRRHIEGQLPNGTQVTLRWPDGEARSPCGVNYIETPAGAGGHHADRRQPTGPAGAYGREAGETVTLSDAARRTSGRSVGYRAPLMRGGQGHHTGRPAGRRDSRHRRSRRPSDAVIDVHAAGVAFRTLLTRGLYQYRPEPPFTSAPSWVVRLHPGRAT